MTFRLATADDIAALVESRWSLQVGEYCQPMVYDGTDGPGCGHRVTVRVTERIALLNERGGYITPEYVGVDRAGRIYRFYPSYDPRRATEAEWLED